MLVFFNLQILDKFKGDVIWIYDLNPFLNVLVLVIVALIME